MEHFEVSREDNCIWLTDKRGEKQQIHLTPSQADEVGKALVEIAAS